MHLYVLLNCKLVFFACVTSMLCYSIHWAYELYTYPGQLISHKFTKWMNMYSIISTPSIIVAKLNEKAILSKKLKFRILQI